MNVAPLIYALGWSLIHSLWQGAILCALAYASISLFQLSAKVKTDLLFVLLFALFLAFVSTFGYYLPTVDLKSTPVNNLFMLELAGQFKKNALPIPLTVFERYFPYAAFTYTMGLAVQLIVLVFGYIRVQRIKHGAKEAIPEVWQLSLIRLLKEMSITKKVNCYLSDQVQSPLVIGFFKPVILFPLAALSALDMAQVETILIHEIHHIRRNDYLLNILKSLIETVLFFNPFVWILGRMLEREREHACDDQVLRLTGNALIYARALLALESLRAKALPAFALGAIRNKQYLLDRIKRMTVMKTANLHARHKLAAMTLLLAGVFGLAWTNPVDTIPEPPVPPALTIEIPVDPLPKLDTLPVSSGAPISPKIAIRPVMPMAPVPPKKVVSCDSLKELKIEVMNFTDSKEWRDYQAALQKSANELQQEALKLNSYFNSREWKAYMQDSLLAKSRDWEGKEKQMLMHAEALAEKSKEIQRQFMEDKHFRFKIDSLKKGIEINQEQLQKRLNSPEFKAKQAALMKKSEELAKQAQRYAEKFNSPEFRAKLKSLLEDEFRK